MTNPSSSLKNWENSLKEYLKWIRSHSRLPTKGENPDLYDWIKFQKLNFRSLSFEQVKKLFLVGFSFGTLNGKWLAQLFELVDWNERKKVTGNKKLPKASRRLTIWVSYQRALKKRGWLLPERTKLLNNIGLDWDPTQNLWKSKFEQLIRFKKRFGHCRVPSGWNENPPLSNWVSRLRRDRKRLSRIRRESLDSIGFDWNVHKNNKEKHFQEAKAFYKRFGHCNVPATWKETPGLGCWIFTLRQKREELSKSDIRRLEKLRIDWDPQETQWNNQYSDLKAHFLKYGYCRVSQRRLENWASLQRTYMRQGTLKPKRVRQLNLIKFNWEGMYGHRKIRGRT